MLDESPERSRIRWESVIKPRNEDKEVNWKSLSPPPPRQRRDALL